jgi:hypothetical protein
LSILLAHDICFSHSNNRAQISVLLHLKPIVFPNIF